MKQYVGLDVSQDQTSICVVDESGRVLWQGKCASTPEAIAATLNSKAPGAERIGLESGPLSIWLCHGLTALGLPVVCLDARHAKAALKLQLNKSDANDARGLAQIVRTGWYREVAIKSLDGQLVRALITARAQLVAQRVDLGNQILLKPFGLLAGKGVGKTFAEKVRSLVPDGPLHEVTEALLRAWEAINKEVATLSRRLVTEARQDDTVCRLMTAPGVGVLVALTYVSTIGDPARFPHSSSVGAYVGLTPRRFQSGETDYTGKISRCGDRLTRTYLYEAAGIILNRVSRWSTLYGVGHPAGPEDRPQEGAVARKLAVILHRMWRDGTEFRWSTKEAAAS